jgi:putative transposase
MDKKGTPRYIRVKVCQPNKKYRGGLFMIEKDKNSLEHTKWRCQYHVVFSPKYRRMAIYGEIKKDIGMILRKLCEQKGVEIIESEACPDHIHM